MNRVGLYSFNVSIPVFCCFVIRKDLWLFFILYLFLNGIYFQGETAR